MNATSSSGLERRWMEIWLQEGAARSQQGSAFAELIAGYRAPERHYHNVAHIEALLVSSRTYAKHLVDRTVVDLAIFYHDLVYDPTRSDNEARSAAVARDRLIGCGLDPARVEAVAEAIEATRHATAWSAGDGDIDHLLDFDLAILAADDDVYEGYARAIRREYAVYPDLLYRPGRAKVLGAFLAMPRIYRVPALAALWEARARTNMTGELARLF